ncbi:MFS general substrate transporter [Dissoconium aciculare CBS 342.82]|uniref:MFS general substrate transporter n=1 Tax=Dissoconium aciculare CBS 342.82 TaxID=1314786 RepID=A0A6J3M7T8_9PEZI|nr:MFS general substrate transporter [Dissoconium aciculare CBS 342.82]KAF1822912.1 MFS general substrate transporter [Dissoconium aciculare CBS 342.82]
MSSAMATSQAAKMEDAETRKSSKVSDEEKALSATDEGNIAQSGPKSNWNKPLRFYLAFLCLLLMVLMVSIDATALGVAIPTLTTDLRGTTLLAFWTNISFMLAVAIIQPIYASVSDVLGRKSPLYSAFFLFGLGSIVFAVAPSMPVAVLGRVIQGLGGGGLDVLSEVIVADITTLKDRALWIGLLSIPMATGCILGPIVGALFAEHVSWRWIGWINLPIIAVALPLAIFFMKLKPIEDDLKTKLRNIDWIGIALFAVGSILFAVPLSWAGNLYPWGSPMFPYRIFGSRTAKVVLYGAFIHGLVLYALLTYLPLYFESVRLETPLQAGVSILPFCAVVMVFTGIAAAGIDYFKKYLWELWAGWIFLTVGVGLFCIWDRNSSLAITASFQVIAGIGLGTIFTVPPIPMQASAPSVEDQGLAIGILVSFRLFGGLIGLAIGATAFSSTFAASMNSMAAGLPEQLAVLRDASQAIGFIPQLKTLNLDPALISPVLDSYDMAWRTVWYALTGLAVTGCVLAFFTQELSLENEEEGKQGLQ